jgi:hypothetical protein
MSLRYTLARCGQAVARRGIIGSESTSGGKADDAHAARGQDDENEYVDGIHVGRRQTPGPMARQRNKRVYTGSGQQDSTQSSVRTKTRREREQTKHRYSPPAV